MEESTASDVGGTGHDTSSHQTYRQIARPKSSSADVGRQVASCVGHQDQSTPWGHREMGGKKEHLKQGGRNGSIERVGFRIAHPGICYLRRSKEGLSECSGKKEGRLTG
jgi:hypothetical protein